MKTKETVDKIMKEFEEFLSKESKFDKLEFENSIYNEILRNRITEILSENREEQSLSIDKQDKNSRATNIKILKSILFYDLTQSFKSTFDNSIHILILSKNKLVCQFCVMADLSDIDQYVNRVGNSICLSTYNDLRIELRTNSNCLQRAIELKDGWIVSIQ